MLADRGYDVEWFRDAREQKGIQLCMPGRKSRFLPVRYDKRRYKRRDRIKIMFGRLKIRRAIATTRYRLKFSTGFEWPELAATGLKI